MKTTHAKIDTVDEETGIPLLKATFVDNVLVVRYNEAECKEIHRETWRDEELGLTEGMITDEYRHYQTPINVVRRHWFARGVMLEADGVIWSLVS